MMRSSQPALSVIFAMFIAACGKASSAPEATDRGRVSTVAGRRPDSNPVHAIVLPHEEPSFPPGSGRDQFLTACVVCHSPRYVTMQPKFSRSTWLSEVKKMKDVYGAHISDEQVAEITDYLVAINGKADTGQGPKGTYGE
jgi:mono/diheme cytochrome c family protein